MAAYHIKKTAITPEDAVRLSLHTTWTTAFKLLPSFAKDIADLIPYESYMGSDYVHSCLILMAIWTAGRVQGIREERDRRKNRRKEGGNNAA